MAEKDLHLQINEMLENQIDVENIERLKEKYKPKTRIQRLKGVFILLTWFGIISQVLGSALASTGVMYYLSTKLSSNGFFIAIGAAMCLVGLEIGKHIVLKDYHSQRLDDKKVSNEMYFLIGCLLLVNSIFAYYGTPHAIEYFTEKPILVSLDSIAAKEDAVLAANIATIQSEIAKHDTTASKIFTSASWLQKLSSKDRPAYQTALNAKAQAEKMVTAVKLQAAANKADAIKEAEKESKRRMDDYLAWCMSFGTWLGFVSLVLDVVFFFAFWWCESYKRLKVKEFEAIKNLQANLSQSTTQSNSTSTPSKVQSKGRARHTINKAPSTTTTPQRSMQFPTPAVTSTLPQEGDIIEPQGKGVKRILVDIKGKGLVPKTRGELNTLIAAQGEKLTQRKEDLINLLKKFEA